MGESKHQPPPQEEAESGGGGRNSRLSMVDPSAVPRWCCQSCRHPLYVLADDRSLLLLLTNDPSRSGLQASGIQGAGSMLSSTRMDQSYVLLPKQRNQPPGIPRPRPGANSAGAVSVVANMNKTVGTEKASRVNAKQAGSDSQSGKAMEESFVVLPSVEASIYKADSASEGGGLHSSPKESPVSPSQANNFGFYSSISVLEQAIQIAAKQTQVDQPLCLECMHLLSEKLEEEILDVNRDIKAYEACLLQLEGESLEVLSESDFIREKKKIDEEERRLEEAIKEIKKQYSQVSLDLKELDSKTKKFNELEEIYWHEFNDFQFQLTRHQEERDAILAKIEISQVHLELLKRTNVLNDAFHIWHDGDFGTINNFRLGRLPKIPVEWDEINAAWGQACLLLHTMAQYFRPKFAYKIKILPMGSYPRVMDSSNNTYELFGPVNLFWSTRYDKAMTLYLACLKDFADFANAKDQENNVPPEKWFSLPYKIENDKVDNLTITQSFNKQENWTKALKCMVCDLKWVLYWFIGNTSFQPHPTLVPSKTDMPTTTTVAGSGKSPRPSAGGSSSRSQSKSSAN